ncbi:hypothetical protein CALCODRAFT_502583 [Calocera cornea HHB12733]|uniref:Uncharacterized protein n=1 Tax=Calocera cornea HHB12733 TaxID=1353952 RepID=A0A165D6P6_9BASI|nr:hypothetical protein CALCODRAFT_502583 [Calocera cornea HHB12733]
MASGSGSRGNPILVDLTSPHRRTVSADHAHNRAVDDLIEEERERQALFYSASQSNASASTSGAGSSRPNTSDGLSQPSSRDPRGRPDGGRQRANTASGGLHMYKLPTVMEESPTEGTNRLPLQPPGPGSSRPRLPLSASDPTITASAAHPHHAHASHSHLRPDLGVSSSTASASTTSGPGMGSQPADDSQTRRAHVSIAGRITRRYSKRKSVTTSKLKTGVIDKGKGVEPEDDLTRNKGKGKAVEAVLERRRSKGKGKATEMNTQAESGRPKKADDVLTFPARPDTRWPGLDLHDFYKEHRADEVEAMKVTGMKRLTPPIVPMAEDQIDQQAPDAGEMAIVEAEEFQLLPNHQVHNFGPGPSLAQAHGGNSPVDTVMGSADYAVGDLAGVLNYDTWIRSQIANDPNGVAGLQDVPLPLESYVSAQLAQQSAPPVSAPGMPASSLPMASQTPLSASVPQWHAPHLFSDLQTELHGNLSPNPAWDDVLSFFDPTLYQSPMVPLQDPQFRTERTMSAENWQLLRQGGVPDVPSGSESSVPYVPPSSHLGTVAPQSYQQFGDTGPSTQVQLHQQFGASGPSTQPQPLQHQAGTGPSTEPQLQQQFVDPGVFNQVQQQGGQPQLADAGQINQLQQQPHFADPGVFNQNQPAQQPQFADTGHLTQVQQQPQFANPGVFTQDQPAQQPQLGDEDQISEIQQQPQFDSEPFFIAVGAQEPFSTMGWDAHMRLAARRGGGQGRGRGQ